MEVLTPADAEQAIIDELEDLTIGTSLPETLPAEFVRIVAAGGSEVSMVSDQFLLSIEGFAVRETTARDLTALVVARVAAAVRSKHSVGGIPAYRMSMGSLPQNLPMANVPTHKRYIATIALDLRRSVSNL